MARVAKRTSFLQRRYQCQLLLFCWGESVCRDHPAASWELWAVTSSRPLNTDPFHWGMELSRFSDIAQKVLWALCWGNLCYWLGGLFPISTGNYSLHRGLWWCMQGHYLWTRWWFCLVGVFFAGYCYCLICHEFYPAARCGLLGPLAKCYPAEHLSCLGKALNASCILLHIFACCICPRFYTWYEWKHILVLSLQPPLPPLLAIIWQLMQTMTSSAVWVGWRALASSPHSACGLYEHIQNRLFLDILSASSRGPFQCFYAMFRICWQLASTPVVAHLASCLHLSQLAQGHHIRGPDFGAGRCPSR